MIDRAHLITFWAHSRILNADYSTLFVPARDVDTHVQILAKSLFLHLAVYQNHNSWADEIFPIDKDCEHLLTFLFLAKSIEIKPLLLN